MTFLRASTLLIVTLLFTSVRCLHAEDSGQPGNSVHRMAGIGVIIGGDAAPSTSVHEYLIIRKVDPNSPAGRANLKANDKIVAIDEEKVAGMKLDDAVNNHLRGEPNTPVKLTILRAGQDKPVTLTLVRKVVTQAKP